MKRIVDQRSVTDTDREFSGAVIRWQKQHGRHALPWQRTRDAYRIWLSEIMLQQTQVATVLPYFDRWLRELPTIESLAHASTDKIHKLWVGLGYYTRVRNMQKAAQQVVESSRRRGDESHSKNRQSQFETSYVVSYKFPETFDAVLALPGIGRYTAGAICSIAFNQPTPILDGNVIRVLTRIHGITTDPREKQTNAQLWQLAAELVAHANERWGERQREPHFRDSKPARQESRPTNSCSHLNQSLMELGALICTPRSPNCTACPVQKLCVAHKENLQDQLPNLAKREAATERRFIAFIVERDGTFLVRQRPSGTVNAHLWEFPNVEITVSDGRASQSVRAAGPKTKDRAQRSDAPYHQNDFRITASKPLRTIKHSITRYRITLEAWRAEFMSPHKKQTADRWFTLEQLEKLAFTSAHRKILSHLVDAKSV